MKILLISSGCLGIYPYLEKSIEETFLLLNNAFIKVPPDYTPETIELINEFNPNLILTMVGYKTDRKLIEILKKKIQFFVFG
ncbi:hypothetical protein [Neobacillus bataviensis]|uniref:hypothetical protein n=1 Tax=Neobacillus bataviensis TaxID=220685 RepID=UPI001CBF0A5E|nr:hypothetical protein [Neobacillus bataviensis]